MAIKTAIFKRASAFADTAANKGLKLLARVATEQRHELNFDVIEKMALGGVPAQYIVTLLEPHLASNSDDQLLQVLQKLGGDYPKLTAVGRDKPKIPNTNANRALLDRLKQLGIVNTYDKHASPIKVNKKYK